MRGLRCPAGFSLVAASGGRSRGGVRPFLGGGSSFVAPALGHVGFSSCGSRDLEAGLSRCGAPASLLRGLWDLPRSGIEPVPHALAGGLFTTEPPGTPRPLYFNHGNYCSCPPSPAAGKRDQSLKGLASTSSTVSRALSSRGYQDAVSPSRRWVTR